ncbi:MAG: zinc-finger domain-containing protein [Hyphomicrobiaceae bacterium]|nr:zinc-finger domain-containing protein [Hyphomicrobiaceae bacterium]
MAASAVPHFCNDVGTDKILIGAKEFQCMGARPPFDHPHVFLDMGSDSQIICPYCSTLFVHDARLGPGESDPASCLYVPEPAEG